MLQILDQLLLALEAAGDQFIERRRSRDEAPQVRSSQSKRVGGKVFCGILVVPIGSPNNDCRPAIWCGRSKACVALQLRLFAR